MSRTIETILIAFMLIIAAAVTHAWLTSRSDEQQMQSTIASQKQLLDAASTREHDRDETLKSTLAQIEALKRANQTPQQIVSELPQFIGLPQPITLATPHAPSAASAVNPITPDCCDQRSGELPLNNQEGTVVQDNSLPETPKAPACSLPATDTTGRSSDEVSNTGRKDAPKKQTTPHKGTDSEPSDCAAIVGAPRESNTNPATAVSKAPNSLPGSGAEIPTADLKPLYNYVQDCRACQAQIAVAKQNSADDVAKIAALTRERDAAVKAAKGGSFFQRLRRNAVWFAIGAAGGLALARH